MVWAEGMLDAFERVGWGVLLIGAEGRVIRLVSTAICQKVAIGLAEVEREHCGHFGDDDVRYVDASLVEKVARNVTEEKHKTQSNTSEGQSIHQRGDRCLCCVGLWLSCWLSCDWIGEDLERAR